MRDLMRQVASAEAKATVDRAVRRAKFLEYLKEHGMVAFIDGKPILSRMEKGTLVAQDDGRRLQ